MKNITKAIDHGVYDRIIDHAYATAWFCGIHRVRNRVDTRVRGVHDRIRVRITL